MRRCAPWRSTSRLGREPAGGGPRLRPRHASRQRHCGKHHPVGSARGHRGHGLVDRFPCRNQPQRDCADPFTSGLWIVPLSPPGRLRQTGRLFGTSIWFVVVALLALLASLGLAGAIAQSGAEDNRAPAGRIAFAALALCAASLALILCIQRLRGKRIRTFAWEVVVTATAAMLIVLSAVVDIASGPL